MKPFNLKVFSAASPVFGVTIAVAILQAAGIRFPLAMLWEAWPQWVVFASLVHTFTALCMFMTNRAFGAPTISQSSGA